MAVFCVARSYVFVWRGSLISCFLPPPFVLFFSAQRYMAVPVHMRVPVAIWASRRRGGATAKPCRPVGAASGEPRERARPAENHGRGKLLDARGGAPSPACSASKVKIGEEQDADGGARKRPRNHPDVARREPRGSARREPRGSRRSSEGGAEGGAEEGGGPADPEGGAEGGPDDGKEQNQKRKNTEGEQKNTTPSQSQRSSRGMGFIRRQP